MGGNVRRMEAIPLGWGALSEQQRVAVETVAEWLVDAIDSLPPIEKKSSGKCRQFANTLDRDRRSQIGFIDGDRGTGKSSVLLTLQDLTMSDSFPGRLSKNVKELRENKKSVVWLETLDMEPLSQGTNLFAAILARIENILDLDMDGMAPMRAALCGDGYSETMSAFQQLKNDAAIVWDRLNDYRCDGDPQTRAMWVNQVEKAGLELHAKVACALDGIAENLNRRNSSNSLFILPVDDFDLAPTHCLELLRLIRMITTPRLFFLVAGNIRIAESVLKLRSEGDLQRLANFRPANADDVRQCANEIAANNMRKLIPPGQRVPLLRLRVEEALDIGENTEAGSLRERLDGVEIEVNQAPTGKNEMSLLQFLLLHERMSYDYSISSWLSGTTRQTIDLTNTLSLVIRKSELEIMDKEELDNGLLVALFADIQRQIKEDWRLPSVFRERLANILDTSVSISFDFESQLEVVQRFASLEDLKSDALGALACFNPIGTHVRIFDNDAIDHESKQTKHSTTTEIPFAGLLFAHDLAVSLWGGFLRHSSMVYRSRMGPIVEARLGVDSEKIAVLWPLPEWWTFRDIERFSRHWKLHYKQCDGRYGEAWIMSILEVVMDVECIPGARGLSQKRMHSLLSGLLKEEPKRTARHLLRDSTLFVIVLIFAPEYMSGLGWSVIGDDAFNKVIQMEGIKGRVIEARMENLKKIVGRGKFSLREYYVSIISPELANSILYKRLRSFVSVLDVVGSSDFKRVLDGHENILLLNIQDNLKDIKNELSRVGNLKDVRVIDELLKVISLMGNSHPFNAYSNGELVPIMTDDFMYS